MDILTKLIVLFLCLYWYKNKKSIKLLFLSIFLFIEFIRKLFLDEILNKNLLSYLTLSQAFILSIVVILYVISIIKSLKE